MEEYIYTPVPITEERDRAEIQLIALIDAIRGFSITKPDMKIGELDKMLPKILKFAREALSEK